MKLNKKGITIVEIIVSISLISIVLIFLLNLFLKVKSVYNKSAIQSEYQMIASNIIKTVEDDIIEYGLLNIKYINETSKYAIILTFNKERQTNLNEPIRKVLKIYKEKGSYYISYAYDSTYSSYLTSVERATGMVRQLPEDAIIQDDENYIELSKFNNIYKVKIPLQNGYGNKYDINLVATTNALKEVEITHSGYYFEEYDNTFVNNNQSVNNSNAVTIIKFLKNIPSGIKMEYFVDSETRDGLTITHNGNVLKDKTNKNVNGLGGQNLIGIIEVNNILKNDEIKLQYRKDSSISQFSDTARITIETLPDITEINDNYYFTKLGKTYVSNNQKINSSTAKTVLIFNRRIENIKIKWKVDSEVNNDKMNIFYNNNQIISNKSGQQSNEYTLTNINKNDTLTLLYQKNNAINTNSDRAIITLDY